MYHIFLFIIFAFAAPNASVKGNNTTPITAVTMQIAAEEGRLKKVFSDDMDRSLESLDFKSESSSSPTINYPVGKPLEVKSFLPSSHKLYDIYDKAYASNK